MKETAAACQQLHTRECDSALCCTSKFKQMIIIFAWCNCDGSSALKTHIPQLGVWVTGEQTVSYALRAADYYYSCISAVFARITTAQRRRMNRNATQNINPPNLNQLLSNASQYTE